MSLTMILAATAFSIILLLLANSLENKKEHFILKLLCYIFVVITFVIFAKVGIDSNQICEQQINYTEASSDNTTYYYGLYCNDVPTTTHETFNYLVMGFVLLFFIYLFFFYSYTILKWAGEVFKKR